MLGGKGYPTAEEAADMDEDRRRARQRHARRLMRALTGEGEPIIITESGEIAEQGPALESISPSVSYQALVELRQREYEAVCHQRREHYATSEEWGNQNQREHEARHRTLHGVADRLDLGFFIGENEFLAHCIYETVMRLPDEVRNFVCDRVVFLSGAWGQAFRGMDWSDKWVILLAPDLPEADATGIVAHEIAHAWRGHGEGTYGYTIDEERDACTVARDWGFTGRGTVFEPSPEGTDESLMTYIN
jgi:hypothetical protein